MKRGLLGRRQPPAVEQVAAELSVADLAPTLEDVDPTMVEAERHAAERSRLQTDAVGGSFWITVQVLLGLPLATVANAVIAHQLGARSYGTLAVYTLVFSVAMTIVNAGVSEATVQWTATHQARAERGEVLAAIRRCSGFHVFVEAPLIAAVTVVLLRDAGPVAMVVGGLATALTMVIGTSSVVMSGLGLNALAARIALAVTVASQTTIIYLAGVSPTAPTIFVGRLALGLLGPMLALLLLAPDTRRAVLRPLLPRRWPPGFLAFAIKICASGVITALIFGRTELLVFDVYGHAEQAGVFALAAGVAGLITSPIDSLLGPLLPATAGLLAINPERAGPALLRGLRTSALLAGLVAAVGIPLLAPLLPLIYGDSFSHATGAFIALAAVSCVQSVNHPVQAFLMAGRQVGLVLWVGVGSIVVDVVIAFATIPALGIAGGVLASCVAQLCTLLYVGRRVGLLLGVSLAAQVRAVAFFADAFAIGALGCLVVLATQDLPAVTRSILGVSVAVLALAVVGRCRRTTGLEPDDIAIIDRGLPRRLRPVFDLGVRVLALRIRP